MAFNFRTPQEQFISRIDGDEQKEIYKKNLQDFKVEEESKGRYFSYFLSDSAKSWFVENGVYLSPYTYISHSHPACKTIENYILKVALPGHVDFSIEPFTFVSCKNRKVMKIKRDNIDSVIDVCNRIVTGKDRARYPDSTIERLNLRKRYNLFLHDEVHYWTRPQLVSFLKIYKPKKLLVTVVFPVEIMFGFKKSLIPNIYTFKKSGEHFTFHPDGKVSEGYRQHVDSGWLLSENRIMAGNVEYDVSLLYSLGPHHLIQITEGQIDVKETERGFGPFNCFDASALFNRSGRVPIQGVNYKTFKKVLIYLLSLKKPDLQSATAKIRQLADEDIDFDTVWAIRDFAERLIKKGNITNFNKTLTEVIKEWVLGFLPGKKLFEFVGLIDNLHKRVLELEPLVLTIKVGETIQENFFSSDQDVEESMDNVWMGKGRFSIDPFLNVVDWDHQKKKSRPYFIGTPEQDAFESGRKVIYIQKAKTYEYNELEPSTRILMLDWSNSSRPGHSTDAEKIKNLFLIGHKKRFASSLQRIQYGHYKLKEPDLMDRLRRFFGDDGLEKIKRSRVNAISENHKPDTHRVGRASSCGIKIVENTCEQDHAKHLKGEISNVLESPNSSKEKGVMYEEESKDDEEDDCDLKNHFNMEGTSHSSDSKRGGVETDFPMSKICNMCGIQTLFLDAFCYETMRESITGLHFERVGRRKVAFCSLNQSLIYCHDTVGYNTSSMPEELKAVIEMLKKEANLEFNTVLIQIYENGSGIPFHRDDESVYADDPILTVNLEGKAEFRVTCECGGCHLEGGMNVLMPKGFQGKFKHAVSQATQGRTSLTFRKQVRNPTQSEIAKAFERKVLCFFTAVASILKRKVETIMELDEELVELTVKNKGLSIENAMDFLFKNRLDIEIIFGGEALRPFNSGVDALGTMILKNGHYQKVEVGDLAGISSSNLTSGERKMEKQLDQMNERAVMHKKKVCEENKAMINKMEVRIDVERACKLANSMLRGKTGIMSHSTFAEKWKLLECLGSMSDSEAEKALLKVGQTGSKKMKGALGELLKKVESLNETESRGKEVIGIFGFAGSGKSAGVQNYVKGLSFKRDVLIISPRKNLAQDWIAKLKGEEEGSSKDNTATVKTFESALRCNMSCFSLIVIDEVSLYPNGYMDLLMMKCVESKMCCNQTFVVLGDPLQSTYHSDQDSHLLDATEEIVRLAGKGGELVYLDQSFRIPMAQAIRFGIRPLNEKEPCILNGEIFADYPSAKKISADSGVEVEVVLVASELEKRLYDNCRCMTFGESQGLTFEFGLISLSEEVKLTSDRQILVALTRFRRGFGFVLNSRSEIKKFKQTLGSRLIGRYLNRGQDLDSYIKEMSPIKLKYTQRYKEGETKVGAGMDEVDREERLEGDPWLKTEVFLGNRINMAEPKVFDIVVDDPVGKIHLPIAVEGADALIIEKVRAREHREFISPDLWSSQFEDVMPDSYQFQKGSSHAANFESIYPRHKMSDDLTFIAAVRKRLRFSSEEKERAKLRSATTFGRVLLKQFLKYVPFSRGLDQNLLDQCRNEFESTKLLKSKGTISAHSTRSDPDWSIKNVFVFMKSQHCTKFEKRFCDAKAGQTLACFQHSILTRFSPFCRYMEKKTSECLPKNFYIHQRKKFEELNKFCVENFNDSLCVESDYEAFDSSQDHRILAFEVALMEHLNIPKGIIDDYIDLKCSLGSRLGNFAIMRFTGEFSTFLFNTFANMAFTFCRYDVNRWDPICFAGDDMCALTNLKVSSLFEKELSALSLKAKVIKTKEPMFCGWRMTRFGLFKEPSLVYERLMCAKEKGRLSDVLESYFLEFAFAYKLGHRLEMVMNEQQIEVQQKLSRFFVRNKDRLKGVCKSHISNLEYLSDESDGEDDKGREVTDLQRGVSYVDIGDFISLY